MRNPVRLSDHLKVNQMQFLKNPGLRRISLSLRLSLRYYTEQTFHTEGIIPVMEAYMSNPNPFLNHRSSRWDKELSFS